MGLGARPMGFAPYLNRLGSLLLPVKGSVLSIVADGEPLTGNLGWTRWGGDPCELRHQRCQQRRVPLTNDLGIARETPN